MEVVIVKKDTYRSHGKINRDDDRIRVVLDMRITEFNRFKRVCIEGEVEFVYKDQHLTTAST
jgi:hypothetical protein